MDKGLLSVGLDVGTTSTQLVVSRLTVENRASDFSVPELQITKREILYRSPVHFTPLVEGKIVDGDKIRRIVEKEYENAGISREEVDTGAVIITGETSRRENAKAVLEALSAYAGDFVVATAGPSLESVLAAQGAGAVEYSAKTGETVLHMDIGGGTANLALVESGSITCTDCLNVGGRLLKLTQGGNIQYISPVLRDICSFSVGDTVTPEDLRPLAEKLTQALEMAAGLREATPLLRQLRTAELGKHHGCCVQNAVISFSGGVADCIETEREPFLYGDMGPILGSCIKNSRLCSGRYRLGSETIRATVIGAGSHSTQLSGSTIFCKNVPLPVKNCPVAVVDIQKPESISQELTKFDRQPVIALQGICAPSYPEVKKLAGTLVNALTSPMLIAMEEDLAKALGQAIALLNPDIACLCIDRVRLREGDYLDIGKPIGPALPVVVKTLILER